MSTPKKKANKVYVTVSHSTVAKDNKKQNWNKLVAGEKRKAWNQSPNLPVVVKKINYLNSESPPNRHIHGGCHGIKCCEQDVHKLPSFNTKLNDKKLFGFEPLSHRAGKQ